MLRLKTKITASIATVLVLSAAQVMAESPVTDFTPVTDYTIEDFWIDQSGPMVDVVTPFEFQKGTLSVMKQGDDQVWTQNLEGGLHVGVDLGAVIADGLIDGRYTYEVRFILDETVDTFTIGQEDAGASAFKEFVTSGFFDVANGQVSDLQHDSQPASPVSPTISMQKTDKSGELPFQGTLVDITTPDNLVVGGGGVFGSTNPAAAVAGKVRIFEADDGSGASIELLSNEETDGSGDIVSFFVGNDQGNFGIQQSVNAVKTTIFGIANGAPENSLRIASNGRVGLGTATPSSNLHILSPSFETGIRLQNASAPNAVEIITDINNFMRFRNPNGSTRMLLDSSGNLGIGTGTSAPDVRLHVRGSGGDAKMLLEETSAIATNTMFTMRNNGNPGFQLENTGSGADWQFRLGGSGATEQFTVNKVGTGSPEATFLANGNLQIRGTLSEGSSRTYKQDVNILEPQEVLERIAQLKISEWSYIRSPGSRHFGPMAEDFYALFGLGDGPTSLSPRDLAAVALAASQALAESNKKLMENNESLQTENQNLAERLERLEKAFGEFQ